MRIIVLGLRGVPNIQGGVETHVKSLYPLLVKAGCDIEIVVRSPYYDKSRRPAKWQGIGLRHIWSPQSKGVEAFLHSLLAVLYAGIKRPDVLHIHAIGPAFMTPLARLLGLRVIVTHHGTDYDREKWGVLARWILRTGEHLGMRFANQRIVISNVIKNMVWQKYRRDSVLIPNGIFLPELTKSMATLQKFAIKPRRYVLLVSRFVPEKRHLDLIKAFRKAHLSEWKLVLVGEIDQSDRYTQQITSWAEKDNDIVLTDFQTGQSLQELYTHAGLFVLPSAHEGHPIALLEALSYGVPVLASDIPPHLEIELSKNCYFPLADVEALAEILQKTAKEKVNQEERDRLRQWTIDKYNWEEIAKKTLRVYHDVKI